MNIFIATLLIFLRPCLSLDYSEIVRLNASCPPIDSCLDRPILEDNMLTSRCECGPYCTRYSTCCIDSIYRASRTTKTARVRESFDCVPVIGWGHLFAISKCNPRWRGNYEVKAMCEQKQRNLLQDPFSSTPATNFKTNTTYKNYFCAVCNNVDEISMWEIRLDVYRFGFQQDDQNAELDANTVKENLVYNSTSNKWGFYEEVDGTMVFRSVALTMVEPKNSGDVIRRCKPGRIISTCHRNWRDQIVRDKCSAYTALMFHPKAIESYSYDIYFRNIHCAICNFVRYKLNEPCRVQPGGFGGGAAGPSMSLTLLLDVNMKGGNRVGEVNQCGRGKLFDPFFKKCRTLSCGLPGYVVRNGKCTRT